MSPAKRQRRWMVTLAAILLGLFAISNLWRAIGISSQLPVLAQVDASLAPQVRLAGAAIWAIIFLVLGVLVWQQRPFTRLIAPLALGLYAAYRLALTLGFVQSAVTRQTWLLQTLAYAFTIILLIIALRHFKPPYGQSYKVQEQLHG